MELGLRSVEVQGAHEAGGAPRVAGVPPTLVAMVWAPGLDSFASIFLYIPKIFSMKFQVILSTFISAQK